MFFWRDDDSGIRRAFTDRSGGLSAGPYAGLNLGGHVGDDPEAVRANRALVAEAFGAPEGGVVYMDQCHGADVAVVDAPPGEPLPVDGVVTTTPGLALGVLVADCTPVLLSDAVAGVVAAVHAGRPGMTSGIIGRAVGVMRELGASRIAATVGPSVCGRCYEVPLAMRESAAEVSPSSRALTWTGTPAIDVAAGVVEQLRATGVEDLTWVPGCSREEASLYSYRRDATTGRYAGLVMRNARG